MNEFSDAIGWVSFLFAAFVIGVSIVVFAYYTNHKHKYLLHIGLMAASYAMLSVIISLTLNYRIFYAGASRFYGAIATLVAFILGTAGLLLILYRSK